MAKKKLKTKKAKKNPVKRKIELNTLTKTVLWSMISGTNTIPGISEALNIDEVTTENEINSLLDQQLVTERGRFMRSYELTAYGYDMLGHPSISLESFLSSPTIKSGGHSKLIVLIKNSGNIPIKDALIKIVSPMFLRIARHGSTYYQDSEDSIVNFNLTHLNPGETQTLEFNIYGNLTSGTVSSKYKIFVNTSVGDTITDKKELNIEVEV